jgi:6-pyruvoyl-tetrahydropterin synthase
VLIDIGRAAMELREVLAALDYRNLDDDPAFAGRNSTTEAVAQLVADRLAERLAAGRLGEVGGRLTAIIVTLHESDVAWASYERAP